MAVPLDRHIVPKSDSAGFRLRPFDHALAGQVARWAGSMEDLRWVAPCTPPPLDAAKVIDWHRQFVSPYILFDPDGTPIGYGELVPSQSRMDEVWIAHLVVAPERRHSGVGRTFVRELMDIAFQDMDAETVSLSVFEDNLAGRACYRRCGFRESGARTLRPVWLTKDEPLVDMRIERFDWLARQWKDELQQATRGADWGEYYRRYRKLRLKNDRRLKERLDVILQQGPQRPSERFVAADFGSGMGIAAEAIARRYPNATVWAFDADPLQVLMGEMALQDSLGDRVRFELADLRDPHWTFGRRHSFAMAVSALSLHWMSRESLRRFYSSVAYVMREGSSFGNSDHIAPDHGWGSALLNLTSRNGKTAEEPRASLPWNEYWQNLRRELGIDYLCEQMAAELAVYEGLENGQPFRVHQLALKNAGFSVVREMWREGGEAVIIAWK